MLFTSAQPSETTQASAGTVNRDHLEKKQVMLQVDLGNIQVHFGSIWGHAVLGGDTLEKCIN